MQITDSSYGVCRRRLKNPRCERRVPRWLTEILSSQQKHREKGKAKFGRRETHEEEENEETRSCVGRSSGRGKRVRWPVGGRERRWRRGRAADFGKINRRAGRKLLDRERHACRKKCNVLLWRRDTGRGDARELRSHGNLETQEFALQGRRKRREFVILHWDIKSAKER